MFENLLKNTELRKLKYYIVFIAMCIGFYEYSVFTGWKYFGTDSEKWAPNGVSRHYHK